MAHRKIIEKNLTEVRAKIAEYERKYSRVGQVQLIAVSKTKTSEAISACVNLEQKSFGENYLQEAMDKIQELKHLDLDWHFIGDLQSNKTKEVAENFNWMHTVHRDKIARRLNSQRPENLAPLNVCIEVNIDDEASKSGISASQVLDFAGTLIEYKNLKLRGLMCIPRPRNNFAQDREVFARMQDIFVNLQKAYPQEQIDSLSMGMSGDLEAAIAEGATMVRIGTQIFGERDY